MTIEIADISQVDREEWDSCVEQAPHATPFHQYVALDLFADYANANLQLLIGYKGQEPVGLLPLFEIERGPFTNLHSPFSKSELMHLGPLRLNLEGRKQRKIEKDHRRFVDACLDWIETTIDPDLIDIWCGPYYTDVRPYLWNDLEAIPRYIYVVNLTPDAEALFNRLNKETRRRIRNTDEDTYEIVEGDVEDTRTIARQVQDRYETQGRSYGLTPNFMAKFHEKLPDEQVHTYCLYANGEFVSGLVTLEFGDTMHVWQGGAATDADLPVNELLYWHVIEWAASNNLDHVDLTTAMVPSLSDYKAKFGPKPKPVFRIQWRSQAWQIAEFGYKQLPKKGRDIVYSRVL